MAQGMELVNIDKSFGAVHALKEVSLDIQPGEALALVGENGAGKSTLMKILTGVYAKDKGEMRIEGRAVAIHSPADAKKLGIGQVYQQAELIPELTVAENVFMGEKGFGTRGFVRWRGLYQKAQALFDAYGLPIDVTVKVKTLNVANQQLVAIAKVLQRGPRLLILDEPTAVLSDNEVELLFKIIRQLKEEKVTLIYISHKLEEVFRIADRIAVMRDGALITVLENENLTKDDLIVHMLGRKVESMYPERMESQGGDVVLEVQNLTSKKVTDISFALHKGEILGIAGLV